MIEAQGQTREQSSESDLGQAVRQRTTAQATGDRRPHPAPQAPPSNGTSATVTNRIEPQQARYAVDLQSPEGDDVSGLSGQDIFDGCKAWLSSMVLHLVAIMVLALLTLNVPLSQEVSLTVGTGDSSELVEVEDLTFDLTGLDDVEDAEPTPAELPAELMEIDTSIDWDDTADEAAIQGFMADDLVHRRSQADEGRAASFFGVEAHGDKIVYIVDRSGSMQGYRWTQASQELVHSLDQLKPHQRFFVFLFSEGAHPMPRMGENGKLVPATQSNIDEAKKWILRQNPDKNTFPLSSVKQALRLDPDTVFLLTDGMFHDATGQYLLQRAEMRKNTSDPDDVVINTIAFHCDHLQLLLMLRDIAVNYSGTFRHVE